MSGAVQLALMVGPLALYLYLLAVWQSGRTPKVVAGQVDFALLIFGIGGLVVFGPIGHILVGRASPFGTPSVWAWLALIASIGLLVLPWLPRTYRRLVIYNIEPAELDAALVEILDEIPGAFERTIRGFEDRESRRGLTVEATSWLRSVLIETYGRHPETLIAEVDTRLRARLRHPAERMAAVAWILLGLCLGLIAPVLLVLLNRPQAREAFRVLLEKLNGG